MTFADEVGAASKPPAGWEPYAEHTDRIGSAIVRLPRPGATERDLLAGAGFDPAEWRISGPINTRKWMRYDQEWLHYYKFDVVAGEAPEDVEVHVGELTKRIRARGRKPAPPDPQDDAWVLNLSDWQVGKREGDDGTPQTVERVLETVELAKREAAALRRAGYRVPTGVIAGVGDIGEGTCGFYPNQQFLIDCSRRVQNRIVRELVTHAIDELSPLFDELRVKTVGGNHGENRNDGKKATDDGDNDDVAQFEAVREAFDRAGAGNISWQIPDDQLSISDTVGGVRVGWTHGHLFRTGGKSPQLKAHEWWQRQDFGFREVRGTQVLVSAHFHHFSAVTYGKRTHLQCPPMDPGSKWYVDSSGEDSPPGALAFRLSASEPLGFSHLQILSPGGRGRA